MIITLEGISAAAIVSAGRYEIGEVLQCTLDTLGDKPAVVVTVRNDGDYVIPIIEFARFIAACGALLIEEIDNGSKVS